MLQRELKEELDLITNCKEILAESIYEYDGGLINLVAINTQIIGGQIRLSVHDRYEWVALENLIDYDLAPADIPIAKWIIHDQTN